jgi:hypothetical protein
MTHPELVTIELTDEEHKLMILALNEYGGAAQHTYRLLCPVLGQSNLDQWAYLVNRLKEAVRNKEPLSDLDWARALFLTEICFGSDLVGAGLDFGRSKDEYWFGVPRSLQYKISSHTRSLLLLQNASYQPLSRDSSCGCTDRLSR